MSDFPLNQYLLGWWAADPSVWSVYDRRSTIWRHLMRKQIFHDSFSSTFNEGFKVTINLKGWAVTVLSDSKKYSFAFVFQISWSHKATEIGSIKMIPTSKGTEQATISDILRVYTKWIYAILGFFAIICNSSVDMNLQQRIKEVPWLGIRSSI